LGTSVDTKGSRTRDANLLPSPTDIDSINKNKTNMAVEAATSTSSESTPLVAVKSATAGYGGGVAAPSIAAGLWKMALGFVLGVALTVAMLSGGFGGGSSSATIDHREEPATTTMLLLRSTLAGGNPAKKKVEEIHPALHYFAKASTEFASTLPLMKDRDSSFLADLVTR
jgi:hypothetical protein